MATPVNATIIDELLGREYGALVLRYVVGRNLMKGVLYTTVVAWALIGGWHLFEYIKQATAKEEPVRIIYIDPTKLALPPSLAPEQVIQQLKILEPQIAPPVAVTPRAVEDEKVADTVLVMTVQDLAKKIDEGRTSIGTGTGEGQVVVAPVEEEYIPKPEEFVPVEKQPEIISAPPPEYPAMARNAGVTGTVIVQFLVKKNGEIGEIKVLKANPPGLGFEDEARKAVRQWKMKPAINNGQPVAIWVTQPIRFKFK